MFFGRQVAVAERTVGKNTLEPWARAEVLLGQALLLFRNFGGSGVAVGVLPRCLLS